VRNHDPKNACFQDAFAKTGLTKTISLVNYESAKRAKRAFARWLSGFVIKGVVDRCRD
jgi:hypothetical protein